MKKVMGAALSLILAAFCVMLLGLRTQDSPPADAQRSVLLLTQEDTGAYFMQLRQGVQKALEEQDCALTTQIIDSAAISDALWSGTEYSGVLIYIKDEALRLEALRAVSQQGLRAATIDAHEDGFPSVTQDVQQHVELAASASVSAERVICLGGGEVLRKAAKSVFRSRWLEAATVSPEITRCAVIALDDEAAARLIRERADGLWAHQLILVNPGENAAAWLESGQTQAAVLPSPYATGYIAAAQALWDEKGKRYRSPAFIVTPDNMYDARHVKLVFPLLN